MARSYGYEFTVSTHTYLKVAMAKRKDKDEIEEEAFDATCRLFDHESDVTVIDNEVTEIHQDDKYFTVADVRLDLRIKVTAHDIDKAIEEAEKVADEVAKRLPAGVSYVESNYYDTEKGEKAIDWDVA
jgi:hypothetical protein